MQRRDVVIGIHGLANKPPKEEKAKWWNAAIREGLARNHCAASALPLDFVYWADLRYDAPLDGERNLEPYYVDEGSGAFPSPKGEAADKKVVTLADRLYRRIGWVQETLGVMPIDDLLIEYRLDDLWGYYEDAAFRDAARARLYEAIARHRGARILLAAHSMGALIAYDVLRLMEREAGAFDIAHLVTMGAPLGLAEIKLKIEEEHGDLRVPDAVRLWSNLVDREDVATVGEDIGDVYAANTQGVRARDVPVVNAYRRPDRKSGGSDDANHHKSYGYLRTPEFSAALRDFLADERAGQASVLAMDAGLRDAHADAIAPDPTQPV